MARRANVLEQLYQRSKLTCMLRFTGFNIAYVTSPGSFEDVVYLLRPELVKRGLMWEDYDVPGGTLRENIYGKGQRYLRDDHYGHKFKFGSGFEGDTIVKWEEEKEAKALAATTVEVEIKERPV